MDDPVDGSSSGAPDYVRYLRTGPIADGFNPLIFPGMVHEESSDDADVQVRLTQNGQLVSANRDQFPTGWTFEVGDLLSVHQTDGGWLTVPEMAHVEVTEDSRTFWVENGLTGTRRRLAIVPVVT